MVLSIEIGKILLPAAIMVVVAGLFAIAIVYLGKKLSVAQDSKVEEIVKQLSGANCGACGYPGCEGFAKALVEGKAHVNDCASTLPEHKQHIAQILGTKESGGTPTVAVVCCNGGNACENKYEYQGYGTCKTAELLAGGKKACPVGCIGLGSCTDACPYFAVNVNEHGVAEVDREKCTSCGLCIAVCPKKLIRRIPQSAKVYVACSNECKGKEVLVNCKNGCIACGLCAKNCPEHAIEMVNNIPVINYELCSNCTTCALKCPKKCIHIIEDKTW